MKNGMQNGNIPVKNKILQIQTDKRSIIFDPALVSLRRSHLPLSCKKNKNEHKNIVYSWMERDFSRSFSTLPLDDPQPCMNFRQTQLRCRVQFTITRKGGRDSCSIQSAGSTYRKRRRSVSAFVEQSVETTQMHAQPLARRGQEASHGWRHEKRSDQLERRPAS